MIAFLAKPQRFIVRPAPGWLDVCHKDVARILESPLQAYKFKPELDVRQGIIAVSECDYRQAMELVLRLSTGHDVEWLLHSGRVSSRDGWADFLDKSNIVELWKNAAGVKVNLGVTVSHPVIGTAKSVRERAAAYLERNGLTVLASGESTSQEHRIRIDSQKNRTQVFVSMAGEPLFKRGYKDVLSGARAPLAEHLAAACFIWALDEIGPGVRNDLLNGACPLLVPFAGTGTLGFEGISQLTNVAPGFFRKSYSFESFSFHPAKTLDVIRKRIRLSCTPANVNVRFGDTDPAAFKAVDENIAGFKARFSELTASSTDMDSRQVALDVTNQVNNFLTNPSEFASDAEEVFLALNPPYGDRLAKKSGGQAIYKSLGRVIHDLGKTRSVFGFVLCGDEASWRIFLSSIRPLKNKTRHFTHGGIDVRLVVFGMS
jgi:23S rRNA G2445 N2-methylase RlmL